jgi:hypothetical protein
MSNVTVINGFAIPPHLSAFDPEGVIGSKVTDHEGFLSTLSAAAARFDWSTCRTPGQAFITLPEGLPFVSSGEARTEGLRDADLVARVYRGVPSVFAHRSKAAPATSLAVVLYTAAAYNADPDVFKAGETVDPYETPYVVVAVLASAAGPSFSATRLVHNLAGGNRDFIPNGDNDHDLAILNRVIEEAKKTANYQKEWMVVCG